MSHYFERQPGTASARRDVDVDLGDLRFTLATDRGVFSHGALDTGTRLLLTHAATRPPQTGSLLDLGCGTGAIALALAMRAPGATVTAVDVNERAIELCRDNASRNGLRNVVVASADAVAPDARFDAIWSNPPVRIGKPALHALLDHWLDRLVDGGCATLVVQRHLGADSLQRWLATTGRPTERLASSKGYRLLRVVADRPRSAAANPSVAPS